MTTRVKPPLCSDCGIEPYICPTDGDYQCHCIVPWLAKALKNKNKKKRPKVLIRVHYDREGKPYQARFLDGYEDGPYPDDAEDLNWLIESI